MHIYFKFDLFIIFMLSLSILCQTLEVKAANAKTQQENATILGDYDYDDYYDENEISSSTSKDLDNKGTVDEGPDTDEQRLKYTASSTFRPTFYIPRRSNHVLEPSCPRACHCNENFKYVQCNYANLKQVPQDLPRTALTVDLSHNAIAHLQAENFENCSKIVEIKLNNNQLSIIDKDIFKSLTHLQRLHLANNYLTDVAPDTFEAASDLTLLDLTNNTIHLPKTGSFLNQPGLLELACSNCSWTALYDDTFTNLSSLTTLKLHQNDFNKKINTRAFVPLRNLIKLKLPELDEESIQELCNLLKSIDNISFKHFDISCFELVLGTSFNESLIFATDPPFRRITGLATFKNTTTQPNNKHNKQKSTKMASGGNEQSSNLTAHTLAGVSRGSESTSSGGTKTENNDSGTQTEKPYQVPISQEAINILLISIMIIAVIGIIIGLICRKDVGGIKTKCCRTRKPEPKDQMHSTEEIPLNKLV